MQSFVIVLLKTILSHVTSLITQTASQNSLQGGFYTQDLATGNNGNRPEQSVLDDLDQSAVIDLSNAELNDIRVQEILAKSVSGILILLLKWFKVSRRSCLNFTVRRLIFHFQTCSNSNIFLSYYLIRTIFP